MKTKILVNRCLLSRFLSSLTKGRQARLASPGSRDIYYETDTSHYCRKPSNILHTD